MRNLKKFLALVLAMIMVVGATAVVSADFTDVAADNKYATAINDLAVKGIVKGTSETVFSPNNLVERYQMALFVARACTGEVSKDADSTVWANGVVPFTDVTSYKGAIQYAYLNGVITGRDAVTFDPNGKIEYQDALTMAVRALGYGKDLSYPWGYYGKAVELGLTENLSISELNKELTRAETAQIIYNMIYAKPADSDVTIAAQNFDIVVVRDVTTFVITATPKQYYATGYAASEAGYVGLQALENGVPTGDIAYYPAEMLGIEAADVENYFNYSVKLINYDAATGKFDAVELGAAPTVVDFKAVTISGNTIKVDGVTYNTVDEFTGAALKNEIIVYSGAGESQAAMVLLTNKDGDIVNYNGVVVATFAYSYNNVNYYVDKDVTLADTKVISEAAALAKYGVKVEDGLGEHVKYATLKAANLTAKAYQLQLFNDDEDGLYERAIYAPIYMSAYGVDKKVDFAVKDALGITTTELPTYTNDAVKVAGTVFSFTYNKQLNTVNVINVATETLGGKLESVKVLKIQTDDKDATDQNVQVVIDGKTYYMGYHVGVKTDTFGNTVDLAVTTLGAAWVNRTNAALSWANLKKGTALGKTDFADFVSTAKVGEKYNFVAYGDNILFIEQVETPDPDNSRKVSDFVVMKQFTNLDLGELYVDLYDDGKVVYEASLAQINGKKIADLNIVEFSLLIGKVDLFNEGIVYINSMVDGEYKLGAEVDADVDADVVDENVEEYSWIAITKDAVKYFEDDKLVTINDVYGNALTFANGTVSADADGARLDQELRLRTTKDTVFYFITTQYEDDKVTPKADKLVQIWKGQPNDAKIAIGEDTVIYTDYIGYGNGETNGRATFVLVFEGVEGSKGFGLTKDIETQYVLNTKDPSATTVKYAKDFGLTGYDADLKLYAYEGAVNIETGKALTIYATQMLYANRLYTADANGVIGVDTMKDAFKEPISKNDFTVSSYAMFDYVKVGRADKDNDDAGNNDTTDPLMAQVIFFEDVDGFVSAEFFATNKFYDKDVEGQPVKTAVAEVKFDFDGDDVSDVVANGKDAILYDIDDRIPVANIMAINYIGGGVKTGADAIAALNNACQIFWTESLNGDNSVVFLYTTIDDRTGGNVNLDKIYEVND